MSRNANKLQVRSIDAARPKPVDYYLSDGARLALRVYPSGRKAWTYRYDVAGRTRRVEHPKPYGKGPNALSLTEARSWRNELDDLRSQGIDPVVHELDKRDRVRRATVASALARAHDADPEAIDYPQGSFGALAFEFYRRKISVEYQHPDQFKRILTTDLLPDLGARMVESLKLGDFQSVFNRIVDRGAPVAANRALLAAKKVMRYARTQGHIEVNPLGDLTRADVGGKERDRECNLGFDEIKTFWRVLSGEQTVARTVKGSKRRNGQTIADYQREGIKLQWQTTAVLKFLLLTGQRIGETINARWGDMDLAAGIWRIPASETKLKRQHLVHLPSLAVELLKGLPGDKASADFVFPANGTETPTAFDRRVITRALDRLLRTGALPMPDFTPHDLRRTVRSRLSDLGVLPHVAEKVLAHKLAGVLAVYDRGEYLPERQAAMQAWDRRLRELIAG